MAGIRLYSYLLAFLVPTAMVHAENTTIHEGNWTAGTPLYTYKDGKIYSGNAISSTPLYTIKENKIYKGIWTDNTPLYTLKDGKVYKGTWTGSKPLLTIKGEISTTELVTIIIIVLEIPKT